MSTNEQNPVNGSELVAKSALTAESESASALTGYAWAHSSQLADPAAGANLVTYLHALRRRWVISVAIGLVCASVLAGATFYLRKAQFCAVAMIRVAPSEKPLIFQTAETMSDSGVNNAFEIYKETQQQLVRSRFVLVAAIRRPEISTLPSIRRAEPDAVGWLAQTLNISFPNKGEIMRISLTGDDPQEVTLLVNAVVSAYQGKVIDADRNQRVQRHSEVKRICEEKEMETRRRRTDMKQLAETLGTTDSETLSLKQQIAVQQYAEYRGQLTRTEFELMRLRGELKAAKAARDNLKVSVVSDSEVESLAMADVGTRQLFERLTSQKLLNQYAQTHTVPGSGARYLKKYAEDLDVAQTQYNEMGKMLRQRIIEKRHAEIDKEINRLENEVAILTEQRTRLQGDVERQKKEAENIGTKSVDIEMMKAEIANLDRVRSGITEEREKLTVEINSPQRIVVLAKADVPEVETGAAMRYVLIGFAGLVGLFLPMAGIVWWDTRAERINSAEEVTKGLGLPVLGSVPLIPAQVLRRLDAPTRRSQLWQMRLSESVNGVVARLLCRSVSKRGQVILITSAVSDEGKTTLATQLATRLARNLRRTLLVDFDLRRPTLDKFFGLPLEPGVCELLRSKEDPSQYVNATAIDHLSVMTAGQRDGGTMAVLANGAAGSLLAQLRNDYDFIVLDSSPVLPVADTRFVSQHVDSVVLSVFRDKSQTPQIKATCEILEAFGTRNIEVVMTGGDKVTIGGRLEYDITETA